MAPDHFRKHWGFALLATAPLTLLTAVPALAQGLQAASFAGAAPLAIAAGAGAFALLAMAVSRTMLVNGKAARRKAAEQIAGLRGGCAKRQASRQRRQGDRQRFMCQNFHRSFPWGEPSVDARAMPCSVHVHAANVRLLISNRIDFVKCL